MEPFMNLRLRVVLVREAVAVDVQSRNHVLRVLAVRQADENIQKIHRQLRQVHDDVELLFHLIQHSLSFR